ncbi:hypothetical protein N7462_004178 [Penicillium macrosclerotiorum]|uniref:uncharacterized protein n=1 Tax=Penicillium macrosclerotiorum TaxID=303699 RepID=UPI0025499E96|nr:uncharacterized protein N7462_004178 [Penicillium macrosclerotiorum]KAJ5689786.1 hypothetical protein N7462_004178 [Penicillium macrosclerotiorum]
MNGRPPKRQRRSVHPESDSQEDQKRRASYLGPSDSKPVAFSLCSKTKPSRAATSSPSPKKSETPPKPIKSKSLHSFFRPATERQRWSSQNFESKRPLAPVSEASLDDDVIEDDYDSYDEIFTQHLAGVSKAEKQTEGIGSPTSHASDEAWGAASKKTLAARPKRQSSKRFLMPFDASGDTTQQSSTLPSLPAALPSPFEGCHLPWAQRFAPSTLDEIAVHKKKVSDVQSWLEEAFSGRRRERLLVLRGPAGCGKTTTIELLSKSVGFDLIEWRNPSVTEFNAPDYVSVGAQFEEFLGRVDLFGGLDLENDGRTKKTQDPNPNNRRVLLVEEFPTVLTRNSSSLSAFRSSLQRYLATASDATGGWMHPPIVMVVSETLLSSASSISDNLTVHRLLGPTLYNHPGTAIIDFNSIAPTFMRKALRAVLEKEARVSRRVRIPGPALLDRIAEVGDIRSAVSSLEFLCVQGDQTGKWGGTLARIKRSRGDTVLTPMEQEALEIISHREASLGMFHAVGKIVYNKRQDSSLISCETSIPPAPPSHLAHHSRPKVSQVAVNELLDETGTDIPTFICALHENYPPSCDGILFTDHLNACIERLSDSDLLSADRKPSRGARAGIGVGNTFAFSAGVDVLRQEEISFQVAARGLLFALPYPVKRQLVLGNRRSRAGDTHKMLFPALLRLWRKTEEIEGLVDSWMKRGLDPLSSSHIPRHGMDTSARNTGVKSWRNTFQVGPPSSGEADQPLGTGVTMMSRHDALLYQLPYMAQIGHNDPENWQLNQITSIRGGHLDPDAEEDELLPSQPEPKPTSNGMAFSASQFEEKLILSDDDIVDD